MNDVDGDRNIAANGRNALFHELTITVVIP